MLVDARSLPDRSVLGADVCIVGGGPAGLVLARELEGSPYRVCVVESGGQGFDPEVQELARLAPAESEILPAYQYRRRQLGGNASVWTVGGRPSHSLVRYLPLDEIDFEPRSWIPDSGWPFARSALDPYYARAHDLLEIGEYSYAVPDALLPGESTLPLDPERVRTSVERFGDASPFLGERLNDLSRSMNVTLAIHATASVLEEAASGGRVERLGIDCLNGRTHTVLASVFVLAAGGIENPRLLLLANGREGEGIGNANDLVGRFFMDHLHVRAKLTPSDRALFDAVAPYDVRVVGDDSVVGCKLNPTTDVMRSERLLNSALKIDPGFRSGGRLRALTSRARLMLKHKQLRPSLFGWSTLPHNVRRFRDFDTYLQIELPPDPGNRVTLSTERDRFGRPLPAVRWQWDDLTRRSVRRTFEVLAEAFQESGVGTLELPAEDPPRLRHREGINHHLGTTRMHDDPRQGVVDANGRVHGVSNLFVAGSSVFPTGGYANPTLTIVALAIRLADHLREAMRSLEEAS